MHMRGKTVNNERHENAPAQSRGIFKEDYEKRFIRQ